MLEYCSSDVQFRMQSHTHKQTHRKMCTISNVNFSQHFNFTPSSRRISRLRVHLFSAHSASATDHASVSLIRIARARRDNTGCETKVFVSIYFKFISRYISRNADVYIYEIWFRPWLDVVRHSTEKISNLKKNTIFIHIVCSCAPSIFILYTFA